jgi:hypothetical protein
VQRERPCRDREGLLGEAHAIGKHLAKLVELAGDRRARGEVRDGLFGGAQDAAVVELRVEHHEPAALALGQRAR